MAAFVLRTLTRTDGQQVGSAAGQDDKSDPAGSLPFSPSTPCEKWIRKRTSVKIKNIGANHRANDLIVNETMAQVIVARWLSFCLLSELIELTTIVINPGLCMDLWTWWR